jgi:cysteine-rich repeat protein
MVKYSSGKLNVSYSMRATIQNLTLNFTADYLSLIANSTIFNQTTSNDLSFAVLPTNNRSALLECCTGYYYNTNINDCSEICGDGLVYVLPCDDGNVADGDGCSSTCQIETDYACLNGTTTTASVCCFNGTITVTVSSAIKDPNSNSLSISYSVSPIQPVLVLLNNSNNFLPYISISNPAATVTAATYDPSTGTVNVQVSYNQSIQGQPMGLIFNPPSVPSASLMPTVANSWTVSPTNHLSAAFYPDSTYAQVRKIQPYSSAVLGVYLSLSMITFFFRKFIGLELATLIQIGYLSLVMNNQLPAYLQSVSAWQYVFGYNYFYLTK